MLVQPQLRAISPTACYVGSCCLPLCGALRAPQQGAECFHSLAAFILATVKSAGIILSAAPPPRMSRAMSCQCVGRAKHHPALLLP